MHEKRPDIQGLRSWAVLSVVVFHFFPSHFHYGFLGVDVFFVLSGFLIAMVLEQNTFCLATCMNFYMKRLRRIVPLAILVISACLFAIALLHSKAEQKTSIKSALYSMLYLKNFQPPQNLEEGYFQALENATDFFTHFWSLSVEIQFYLLAPLISHLIPRRPDVAHMLFMATISAGSLAYSLLSEPKRAFDSTPARLWQFFAGSIAFNAELILKGKPLGNEIEDDVENEEIAVSEKKIIAIPIIFALGTLAAVFYYGNFESILRVSLTFLTAILLVFRLNSLILTHAIFQLIVKLFATLFSVALAFGCHFTFEKWYLQLPTRETFVLIGFLYVFAFAILDAIMLKLIHTPEVYYNITPVLWKVEANEPLTRFEIEQTNDQMERDNWKSLNFLNCTLREGNNPFGLCDLKNGSGSLHFMIMGNSYAANLGSIIQDQFKPYYGRIQSRVVTECEPFINTNDAWCPVYTKAHTIFDEAVKKEKPDVLFFISRYIKPDVPLTNPVENDTLYHFIESRVNFFEQHVSMKIFIMQAFDKPAQLAHLEKRRRRKGFAMHPYMAEAIEADAKPMRERIARLAKSCSKCVIFDIEKPFLNEAGNFTVLDRNLLRFFDEARHLTIIGRRLIEPVFGRLADNFNRLIYSHYPDNIVY